jgi:hypothetical protein
MKKNSFQKLVLTLLLLISHQMVLADSASDTTSSSTTHSSPQLKVMMTVDWEGRVLDSNNLKAMQNFRRDFPEVPIVHYLNAAYFTKPFARSKDVAEKIRSVLLPIDEQGLHLHAWKSLFTAANVKFRYGPTFWNGTPLSESECTEDCGHQVTISAYTTQELEKVLAFSMKTLEKNGFDHAKSFRSGGWMSYDNVLDALAKLGFTSDSSAVPVQFLSDRLSSTQLFAWLSERWRNITPDSGPFPIRPGLIELTDNGALADYVSSHQMIDTIERGLHTLERGEAQSRVVVIGFHQETAATFLARIRETMLFIRQHNQNHPEIPITFTTAQELLKTSLKFE